MKKFFTLIAAVFASSSMMAQDVEYGDNINANSGFEGDSFDWVCAKPSLLNGEANGDIFSGADVAKCVVDGVGVGNSKALVVTSAANPAQPWDAQLWINLPADVEVGEKFFISFSCRAEWDDEGASETLSVGTQGHTTPGNYLDNNGLGDNVEFGKDWNDYEYEFTPSSGQLSIAFNLSVNGDYEAKFYLDNLVIKRQKQDETLLPYWKPVVTNGDFEGENTSNYIVRIYQRGDNPATPVEGIGVEESRGIQIAVPAKVDQTWDSQFFIKMNESIPAGDLIKVSFDYKASEDLGADIDTQSHGINPGDYNDYRAIGNVRFTTEWKHFEYTQSVTTAQSKEENPYQNIAFNLAQFDHEVILYFDNIEVKHKVMVGAGENPARIALTEYLESLGTKYAMDNLVAEGSCNADIRDAFSSAYTDAMSADDDADFEAVHNTVLAAEAKFAASLKDYSNLKNFIALINEKAEQAGETFSDLKDALEAKAQPLQDQIDNEKWLREDINAVIDNNAIYAMVAEAVKPVMKAGDDVTLLMNNSNYAWGSANWTGNVTTRVNSAERWHVSFDVYQTIADMPKGSYTLKFKGFQRHDTNDNGEVGQHEALVYANESAKLLIECGDDAEVVPSSMETAREAFDNGLFENEFAFVLKEAGDLKIGVKGTNGLNWVIWSDFQLIYNGAGVATMAAAVQDQIERAEAVLAELEDGLNEPTVEKAQETIFQAGKVVEGIATATEDDCNKAIASLIDVIAEMQAASKLMAAVSDAYTNFLASYDEFADNAADDIKARAEKAAASFEEDSETYYGKMSADELNAYVAELQFLTGALKVDKNAKDATDENPFDMTSLFEDPDFEDYATVGQNANYPGWAGSGFGTGGGVAGPVAERWNQANGFDTYVDFVGLPEGTYVLACDGAYRVGGSVGDADYKIVVNGEETDQAAYLYATTSNGKREVAIHNIYEGKMTAEEIDAINENGDITIDITSNCETYKENVATGEKDEKGNDITTSVTYYFPNQLFTADQWMQAGKYKKNEISFYVPADGKARVGVARYKGTGNNWAFLDNFSLTYYGAKSAIDTAVESVKIVEASKGIYTISGVRVQSAAKPGLYIVNGKKIVVK
ncbi:MAG: hypothetical protein MJZ60_06115 [Bacteroidaceae bacterium]|nr:hypothetical protein [Bacteroidaceae bacterium]